MTDRPTTTLFLLVSVDGKITTGDIDTMDTEDFRHIVGLKEGLPQYYEIEKHLDRVYLNSGKVLAKVGFNSKNPSSAKKEDLSFVVVDNKPHLTIEGYEYLAKWCKNLYLITTNDQHPANSLISKYPNIKILKYSKEIDFLDAFSKLKTEFHIERMVIQTGGTLNSIFLRSKLIDYVSIVIAPCLIGGKNTEGLIGGESLHIKEDLIELKSLKLVKCDILKNSYLHLQYEVNNDTIIDG